MVVDGMVVVCVGSSVQMTSVLVDVTAMVGLAFCL